MVDLVKAGGHVSILDMNEGMGKDLVLELGGSTAICIQTDVSNTESIAAAVKTTLEWVKKTGYELGGVVAAAGVANPAKIIDKNGEPFDIKAYDFLMSINVRGTLDLVRQILPYLTKVEPVKPDNERGVIIMVASSAAFDGQPGNPD